MVNIKVIHKEAVRRFTLSSNATWIELEAKLRPLFTIPALSPFTLSYTDEDNDVITLSTDIELQEILSSAPTVKFNLKFSTSDDSSDSEDSSNEVWVLEGGNVPQRERAASVSTIESDISQDNVTQKNINNTTNQELQEPQYVKIESRDISETKKIQVDDELKNVKDKKVSQVNLLDDEFFDSINSLKLDTPISQPQPQPEPKPEPQPELESESESESESEPELQPESEVKEEQKQEEIIETSSSSNTLTFLEQDQPRYRRQRPVVDLQQFQMMIEQNQDAIKENPQLVASIKDIMDQIQRLDSFRQPTIRNNFFARPITPPIPGCTRHTFSDIPPTTEFHRSLTPPIPGSFPKKHSVEVAWAAKEPKSRGGRRGRGRGRGRFHTRHNNHHRHEQKESEGEETQETPGTKVTPAREITDFQILYNEQLECLGVMGFENENELVGLLDKHEGDVQRVLEDLLP